MAAAALNDKVSNLVLLDNDSFFTISDDLTTKNLQKALDERNVVANRKPRIYPNIEEALNKLLKNNPYISKKSAKIIVERGTERIITNGLQGIRYRHDTKLVSTPYIRITESQIRNFIENVKCPTLVIWATDRAYKLDQKKIEEREKIFKNLTIEKLNGGHHIHLEKPKEVFDLIMKFLDKNIPLIKSKL